MKWLLPVYFTVVHWSQRNVRIRGAALGRIISNVHIVLCTAFSCLPLTLPIRFPFHLGESIFLCSCFFIICLRCCILVSQILCPSDHSYFRLLAFLVPAGCQLWCDRGCRAQDVVFPFQGNNPSHCSPCWPGQMIEGKVCSSSASILLEMSALGNVYRSCVEAEYVQFSFSALKIKLLLWFEILKTWLNLEQFSLACEKPVELVSGLSWNI